MKRILHCFLLVCLLLSLQVPVQAKASLPRPDLIPGQKGTLNVQLRHGTMNPEPLPGVSMNVLRTADLHVKDQIAWYESTDSFASLNIDYATMTVASSQKAAKTIYDSLKNKESAGVNTITDHNGTATVTGLEPGMYLVYQNGTAQSGNQTVTFNPFLVAVPEFEEGDWNYEVSALPKAGLVSTVPVPVPTPDGNRPDTDGIPGIPSTGTTTTTTTTNTPVGTRTGSKPNTSTNSHLTFFLVLYVASAILFLWLFRTLHRFQSHSLA